MLIWKMHFLYVSTNEEKNFIIWEFLFIEKNLTNMVHIVVLQKKKKTFYFENKTI